MVIRIEGFSIRFIEAMSNECVQSPNPTCFS